MIGLPPNLPERFATRPGFHGLLALAIIAGLSSSFASTVSAQSGLALPCGGMKQQVRVIEIPDPNTPEAKAAVAFNKARREAEKDLSRIRLKHFGPIGKTEIRQAGIIKLRKHTSPAALAAMVEVFHEEAADVRGAVLDHMADQKTAEADAALGWAAVFDKNRVFRGEAAARVARRAKETGEVPLTTQQVIAAGLSSAKAEQATAAGQLANILKLFEAIPMMAAAQAGPASGYWGGQPDSPDECLAYIVVGTQRSFVADLNPVVGENAVAFDPQVGVITEGVVLRVINAFVFQYNGDLHSQLVNMTTEAWGQPTAHLGWDAKAWQNWYDSEFKPFLAKKEAEKQAEKKNAEAAKPAAI